MVVVDAVDGSMEVLVTIGAKISVENDVVVGGLNIVCWILLAVGGMFVLIDDGFESTFIAWLDLGIGECFYV